MKLSQLVQKIIFTDKISEELYEKGGNVYTFLNPVSYLLALKNRETFLKFDGIFADGSILCNAIKLLYGKSVTRRSFDMTSLAKELFAHANRKGASISIVASEQVSNDRAMETLATQYPNIKWIGCRNGYFKDLEEQQTEAKHISELNPDFLIVGMGTPAQEKFLLMCKMAGYKGIGFTCGGFIHQTAIHGGTTKYYPDWIDRYNLRFLYRMYKEPHTRKRYLIAGLVFPLRFVFERLFGK